MNINEIYQRMILDYAKLANDRPKLTGDSTYATRLSNPTCGDRLQISFQLEAGTIQEVAYNSDGCIIFKSSLAMMEKLVIGKTIDEVNSLVADLSKLMIGESLSSSAQQKLGDAIILHSIVKLPVRIKCAMLPWKATFQALNGGEHYR